MHVGLVRTTMVVTIVHIVRVTTFRTKLQNKMKREKEMKKCGGGGRRGERERERERERTTNFKVDTDAGLSYTFLDKYWARFVA